jgi:hypothetical protein
MSCSYVKRNENLFLGSAVHHDYIKIVLCFDRKWHFVFPIDFDELVILLLVVSCYFSPCYRNYFFYFAEISSYLSQSMIHTY